MLGAPAVMRRSISIHAARVGSDEYAEKAGIKVPDISIHAARVGSDQFL